MIENIIETDDKNVSNMITDYYEKIKLNEYKIWKAKLNTMVHSKTYCGICLEDAKPTWDINEAINIAEFGPSHESTFRELLADLCNIEAQNLFANNSLCEDCADIAIKATLFIHNTKKSSKIISTCLLTLGENIESTLNTVQNFQDYERSIICLSLQDVLDTYNDVEENKDVTNKYYSNAIKIEYKCPECEKVFNKLDSWKIHIEFHKRVNPNQSVTEEKVTEGKSDGRMTQCNQCKLLVFNSEYDQHVKLHVQKTWHCTLCDKVFYSSSSFDTHIIVRHDMLSKENLITCQLCLKIYFSKDTLNGHKCKYRCSECPEMPCVHEKYLISYKNQKEAGHKMIECVECDFVCSRKSSLLSHANLDHLNCFNHLCESCSQTFHTKHALTQHKLKYHGGYMTCEFCDGQVKGKFALEKHQLLCQVVERNYKCVHCVASFESEEQLAQHQDKHENKEAPCTLCSMIFTTQSDLDKHLRDDHKTKIPCSMCTEDFDTKEEYIEHTTIHPPGTKHVCRLCDHTFNSRLNYRKHLHLHSTTMEKTVCPVCAKPVSPSNLRYHMDIHTNEPSVRRKVKHMKQNCKCDLCNKWFSSDKVLRRHREKHKEEVECGVCKRYIKPMLLESHMENHKLQKSGVASKKMKCNSCDYATNYPLCMDAHVNRMHLKSRPYSCERCGKCFYGKITLYEHVKSHADNTVRGRQCEHCGEYFCNSFSLKTHMRLHTGEKPYKCDECDNSFISASRRKEHKLKRHSVPKVPCPICKNIYFSVRDVRSHIKKTHCNMRKGEINVDQLQGISEEHMYIFKDHRLL